MSETAKIFWNGRSQAVRLPADFRFDGKEVYIRRDPNNGDVILSPKAEPTGTWDRFLATRDNLAAEGALEDFSIEREDGRHERDDPLA